MLLISKVRRMPAHLAFFTQRKGMYYKVMVKKSGRILEVPLGRTSDYRDYRFFVLFVSKFIPANHFLTNPVLLEEMSYEKVLVTAEKAGLLYKTGMRT